MKNTIKNIMKNYNYMAMISAGFISIVLVLLMFIINDNTYFTIGFVVQILLHFAVSGVILLGNLKAGLKFKYIILYLLSTFALLVGDVALVSHVIDDSIYSNVMYVTNLQLYLALYFVFVISMCILSGYAIIKNYEKKPKNTSFDKSRQNDE